MFRVRLRLFVLPLLWLSVCFSFALGQSQAADPSAQDNVVRVKLGESTVQLAGPWKFHIGDDPAWASADFDDLGWEEVDLTPGSTGLAAGWTARGHAGYSGYAWYRLQADVVGANRSLALKMPDSFDDAYQVFVNGQRVGEFGRFGSHGVTAYSGLPTAFRLPKGIRNGKVSFAVRMWMDSATPFNSPDAGGLHEPPVLGYASAISTEVKLDWDEIGHLVGSGFLEMLILLMALLIAFALFWLDRQEKSYLWLALVCEATVFGNAIVLLDNFTTWIGLTASVLLIDVVAVPLRIGLWVLFWGYWFRLERIRLLHRAVWSLVVLLAIGTAMLRPPLYGQHVPVHAAVFLNPFLLIVKLALGVLLFWVAYKGFKKNRREGVMASVAILLTFVANYSHELRLIHVKTSFAVLGFAINLGSLSTMLSLLIITVLLLRRFITAQRVKEQWKLEIAQARHIQEVLIPRELPQLNDLHVESEYRPAREVGGDFFQIVPNDVDGTSLIAFGDVTGKGLQAGMLVAMIIGAIRSAAEHDNNPHRILELLMDSSANVKVPVRRASYCGFRRTELWRWQTQDSCLHILMESRCRLRARFLWGCCRGWIFLFRPSGWSQGIRCCSCRTVWLKRRMRKGSSSGSSALRRCFATRLRPQRSRRLRRGLGRRTISWCCAWNGRRRRRGSRPNRKRPTPKKRRQVKLCA
jgi:hypothetical protein